MSLLSKASAGLSVKPQLYVIIGPNGSGKSTLAAQFPQSLMLDLEDGSGLIAGLTRIAKKDVPSIDEVKMAISEMKKATGFKTFIIDSVEALESLIHKSICQKHKVTSVEDIPYGKGFVLAREAMEEVMHELQALRDEANMNVILVAHSQTKTFTDPNGNVSYDRYIMRANDKLASIVKDLADSIYFLTYKVDTVAQKGKEKVQAYGSGDRVLYTQWRPGFDAKSRYPVPFEIVFNFEKLQDVVDQLLPTKPEDIYHQCQQLIPQIKDETIKAKALKSLEDSKNNIQKLTAIKQRLNELRG